MVIRIPDLAFDPASLGKTFGDFFDILAQFVSTTSDMELNYYHQKMIVRVASRVAKRLILRILGDCFYIF